MALRRATAQLIPQLVATCRASSSASVGSLALVATRAAAPTARSVRHLHASPAAGSRLAEVLQRELAYENDNYEQPEEVAAGPPNSFTLTETKGDCLLKLTKTYNGESVTVEVMANEPAEDVEVVDEETGEDVVGSAVGFSVVVTKGPQALVFTCTAGPEDEGGVVNVDSATLEPAEGDADESAYSGPIYEELDPELTAEFDQYLRERGIDEALGRYVTALAADKETREYADWLERVKKFVQ